MKPLSLFATSTALVFGLPQRLNTVFPSQIDTARKSTDTANALGSCTCDITLGSCDAYCCCDRDCAPEITAFWNDNSDDFCAKNFIGSDYKPQQKCIDAGQIYGYNQRMGMVVTERDNLLCVEMDTDTRRTDYLEYVAPDKFDGIPKAFQFNMSESLFTQTSAIAESDSVYRVSESMHAYQANTPNILQNFPLPQSNTFGFCDNYKAPGFLQNIEVQSCSQVITDVSVAASSFLNSETYTSFSYEGEAKLDQPVLGRVLTLAADGTITEAGALTATTASGCSVSNAVKRVDYTVRYTTQEAEFKIAKIVYDITLETSVDLCAAAPDTPALYQMEFGIKFVPYQADESVGIAFGNPGYVPGRPLLMAAGEDDNQVKTGLKRGFMVSAAAPNGDCLPADSTGHVMSVNFLQDAILSCKSTQTFASVSDFQTFCESGDIRDVGVISRLLNDYKYVGVFGNADPEYKGDWDQVITSAVDTVKGTFDAERQICTKNNNLQIEILVSQIGSFNNPQSYVVGMQMSTPESEWVYGVDDSYLHFVSIVYKSVTPELLSQQVIKNIQGELFYPLMLGNTL